MDPRNHEETAVLLVENLKRLLYAFDRLDEIADVAEPGSAQNALYFDSIYNYTAQLFLLSRDSRPLGGTAYVPLQELGLAHLLAPMKTLLDEPLDSSTFGAVLLKFRNKGMIHTDHQDSGLDPVYELADMSLEVNQARWMDLLHRLRDEVGNLAVGIALSTGRPPEDFGIEAS